MPNFAIVIGIEHYLDPAVRSLQTPVDDALRMTAWLLDAATGGKVLPENLLLLLGPANPLPVLPVIPAGSPLDQNTLKRLRNLGNLRPATHDNLLWAPVELDIRAQSSGDRLYVYYAGHGMQSRISFSNEDAIVPLDYRLGGGGVKALSLSSLFQFFQATQFREQYFFLDCCRNLFTLKETRLEGFDPKESVADQFVPDQFIIYATAPGLKALDGRGMLTDLLLDGLAGKGKAKLWDGESSYIVRPTRLFAWLVETFDALRPIVGVNGASGQALIQRPRLTGEHSRDPDLVTLPETAPSCQPVPFDVKLTPTPLPLDSNAALELVSANVIITLPVPPNVLDAEFQLQLKPRLYTLKLTAAAQYNVRGGPWQLDVYEATVWPYVLQPLANPVPPQPPVGGPLANLTPPPTREGGGGADFPPIPVSFSTPPQPKFESAGTTQDILEQAVAAHSARVPAGSVSVGENWLTVTPVDALSIVALESESGAAALDMHGRPYLASGRLECGDLAPGIYRVRIKTPDGLTAEQAVQLPAGKEPRTLEIAAARQSSSDLGSGVADFAMSRSRSVTRTFPRGEAELGTLDELCAPGDREFFPFPERVSKSGIEVLLAADLMPPASENSTFPVLDQPEKLQAHLAGVRLWVWPLDGKPGADKRPALTGMGRAEFVWDAAPGPYWLGIKSPLGLEAAFAMVVLDDRHSRLTLHQTADGEIRAFKFNLEARAESPLLRRLDLVQRLLHAGQMRQALATVAPLLTPNLDPLAGCLGGHLLLRERQKDELGQLAERMIQRFSRLPDSYVLRACFRELTGQLDGAREDYASALERGLPLFARHLQRLVDGADRMGLGQHRRYGLLKQVAERLIPGSLWSAWVPPQEDSSQASFTVPTQPPVSPPRVAQPQREQGVNPMANQDPYPLPASQPETPVPPLTTAKSPLRGYCMNQPNGGPLIPSLPATAALSTLAMADKSKLWDNGKTLNVSFLNGTDSWSQTVRQAVREIAPLWCDYANLTFQFDQPSAHIAVNLLPIGLPTPTYNCFLGTDCLAYFKQGHASMNLIFNPNLQADPDRMRQELSRVIRHEFGHAIGLIHEHQRADRPMTWNMNGLRQMLGGPPNNWSDDMIQQQIINTYKGGPTAGTGFDVQSIMMYQFPAGMAFYDNGTPFVTPNNVELTPMDKVLANMHYPATGVTDPAEGALVLGDPPLNASIASVGQVARFRLHVTAPGICTISTQGGTPLLLSILAKRQDPAGQLLAVEGADPSLAFQAVDADKDYFVEVRHAQPMKGTGDFSISVEQQ